MTPNFSIPTDNIYKFACLFGLALIVVSIFSYVSTYTASLDRKVRYMEIVIPLEAKVERSKTEGELLALNKKLIEVATSNEGTATSVLSVVFGIGVLLSIAGAHQWYEKIQVRDDSFAQLQLERLVAEAAKLQLEIAILRAGRSQSDGVDSSVSRSPTTAAETTKSSQLA